MKIHYLYIILSFYSLSLFAQSDVDSPYSLFGVGKESSSNFGATNGLGNTGIAYSNGLLINKINPASLTAIEPTSFLYEIGLNSTLSVKADNSNSQTNYNFNFTHIGIGFSVSNRWKMSFGLVPKTKTSYNIDLIEPVEGNLSNYYTNVAGSGGVNEVFWGHGFKLAKNLSIGLELHAYFGSIIQEKNIFYESTQVYLKETNGYTGLGIKGGFQYKINNLLGSNTTIGAIINTPTSLNGSQDIEGFKTIEGTETSIIEETDIDLDDFYVPLKVGFGISSQIRKLTVNLDYQKNYWSDSYTSNTNFSYSDQNIYGLGLEYKRETKSLKYYRNIVYRMGLNYDTGYLSFSDTKIDSYGFSAGIGLPMSNRSASTLNLSYSYGKEGTLNNNLVMDNFHKLSLNISLHGNWFQKKKIF